MVGGEKKEKYICNEKKGKIETHDIDLNNKFNANT